MFWRPGRTSRAMPPMMMPTMATLMSAHRAMPISGKTMSRTIRIASSSRSMSSTVPGVRVWHPVHYDG